jgi:dephospho-CoA kinase
MKVIGLTGGIGSGKSTIARVFSSLGVPVFDADREAQALYATDPSLLQEVVQLFGKDVMHADGTLNRPALATRVFANTTELKQLNALVHPRVAIRFQEWKAKQKSSMVIREAAILFESGSHSDCDCVIAVTAPEELRIQRVMKRNGIPESDVRARIARQWPAEKIQSMADAIIINDDQHLVLPQVMKVIETWTDR